VSRREHIISLPNALTVIRLPMAVLLWVRLGDAVWLGAILAAAALSDILDGKVARWIRKRRLERGVDPGVIGESYAVGAWLDPVFDKMFAVSAMFAVFVGWQPAWWLVGLVLAREVILVPFAFAYHLVPGIRDRFRFDFRASVVGKAATVAQFAALCAIAFYPPTQVVLAVVAAVVGFAAAVSYLRRALITARYVVTNEYTYARWLEIQNELHPRA
jgi:phosphatidylglycerophosphate synthase